MTVDKLVALGVGTSAGVAVSSVIMSVWGLWGGLVFLAVLAGVGFALITRKQVR